MENKPELKEVWKQQKIPVVYRPDGKKPILLRLPYKVNNYHWIKGEHRNFPKWNPNKKCWEIPKAWFDDIIRRSVSEFGSIYVIQLFREQQKCAPACWNASAMHCECSCMGANHGSGNPNGRWYIVSDTFAVQWGEGERQYSCRLIKPPDAN